MTRQEIEDRRFQSTHPRGVRLKPLQIGAVDVVISIHAPTWGATCPSGRLLINLKNFNPRTHVGCDETGFNLKLLSKDFNPRTHVGCDNGQDLKTLAANLFQSTHPRGVRPVSRVGGGIRINFNPRTHVGCDVLRRTDWQKALHISIHAPTWGATPLREHHPHEIDISIHAPTWGATQPGKAPHQTCSISIHAPTWGATQTIP